MLIAIGLGPIGIGFALRLLGLITIGIFYGLALVSLEIFLIFTAFAIGSIIKRKHGINCRVVNRLYGFTGFYISISMLAAFTPLVFNIHTPQWVNTTITIALIVALGLMPVWILMMVFEESCRRTSKLINNT
ncbi:hypothetical protein [Vulcanisaeta distributa]|uniref:hypothetical protein n=1 Tax=Vulcanisaeta distributa TaxID=164451 RepID=UPI001FB22EF5|nr:hypothetical protein [Vulcanisaeta distributa]